ncbi:N-carbamoyl-L-amino-acid hydrolase [Aquiflexum balticum DSM 16537]|uniref:N-carbamoyl-L-amino-acid hydrolase n=1 Tax=Aquiflexum balticum DSM 16537 TaxID=758820 RepID=A0A1W2H056_9BACT|nr:M20 family metallo-hydrolase [Aquiflexum balticum]SMD42261.1 N-carbamoyl-L-amino-acid hydrolase [Aquiflexum balticum DSM 16537]
MKSLILSISLWLFISPAFAQGAFSSDQIKVNEKRIEKRIFELAEFGINEKGEPYRVAYSMGDLEGRAYFMDLMRKAGLEVHIDYAGNIIGRRAGKDPSKKPIAFGSHIDMVPNGGNYDGTLGSFTALEIIEVLNENKIITDHPLEVIIFQNEEGGLVGSRALTGNLKKEALSQKSASGLTLEEGIRAIGGDPEKLDEVVRKKGDLAAFLEIHIEQSKVLESRGIDVAIVEGIVGIDNWDVTVIGMSNHAGSTPMNDRQDALIAASKLVLTVNEVVNSYAGAQVGNVGKIFVPSGAPNIIPGRVEMSLELRDLSKEKIRNMFLDIEKRAEQIAAETNTEILFENLNLASTPTMASKEIQDKMIQAAESLGISYINMQSGAGHDVQEMGKLGPIGLVFIPSKDGISHNPKEYSSPSEMANGANVMLRTVLLLDKGLSEKIIEIH